MSLPPNLEKMYEEPASPTLPRQHKRGRKVLLAFGVLFLAAAIVAGGYVVNLANIFNSNSVKIEQAFPDATSRPQAAESADTTSPKNLLLMGSDTGSALESDALDGEASDQRADTLMLVHIPADRKNVYTISLMRDLWVNVPGHGQSKINSALAYGGVPLMVQTVESLFEQRIDHVVMVNFDGFEGLTDALGGLTVDSNLAFNFGDLYSYNVGPNLLNGKQALGFVRERYSFPDGDYQRVRNQQAFLKALIDKTVSAETLSNPVTVHNMVQAMSPYISVDKSLDAAALAGLGFELRNVREKDIAMFTLPTNGTGTSADGQSIVLPNPEAISNISEALASDSLDAYVAANNFQGGN